MGKQTHNHTGHENNHASHFFVCSLPDHKIATPIYNGIFHQHLIDIHDDASVPMIIVIIREGDDKNQLGFFSHRGEGCDSIKLNRKRSKGSGERDDVSGKW
jgi:hypothetical protein